MRGINVIVTTIIIGSMCCCNKAFGLVAAETLADYLVPPAAPAVDSLSIPQRPSHTKQPSVKYESSSLHRGVSSNDKKKPSSLLTRVARWLGFAGTGQPQTLSDQFQQNHRWKDDSLSYSYTSLGSNLKAPCYLCNNYPWVPMLPLSVVPQSVGSLQNTIPHQLNDASPHKQREKFVSPHHLQQPRYYQYKQQLQESEQGVHVNQQYHQAEQHNFPLISTQTASQVQITSKPAPASSTPWLPTQQALPFVNAGPLFSENEGAHSELQPSHLIATQITPSTTKTTTTYSNYDSNIVPSDAAFEIVKSEQVTHFVSSVEYPAQYEQSQSIDVPTNHRPSDKSAQAESEVVSNAAEYQHTAFTKSLDQRTPASQLLTDIGSFGVGNNIALSSQTIPKPTKTTTHTSYKPYEERTVVADNLPSASGHELLDGETNPWKVLENESDQTKHIVEVSTTPSVLVERHRVATIHELPLRETPKHLLRSPLQHNNELANASPRPFTRDPADLNFRLGALKSQSSLYSSNMNTEASKPASVSQTPTNVYDAAGQFANMLPPAPPPMTNSGGGQQIIVPYTTMNRPRPFESQWSGSESNHIDYYQQEESKLVAATVEAITPPPHMPRKPITNKYLTKVLASNLRELLRREQERQQQVHHGITDRPVDLLQLQQNIDDWTEQEFTSLSHRPSTPTIRGRSKHIPSIYLTTTPTPPPSSISTLRKQLQSAVTIGLHDSSLSTSINNLESRLKEYSSPVLNKNDIGNIERFSTIGQHIDDNHLHELSTHFANAIVESAGTGKMFADATAASVPTTVQPQNQKDMLTSYFETISSDPSSSFNAMKLWEKAKVLISPVTKEKVYVVTPQPLFFPQRFSYVTSTETPPVTVSTAKPLDQSSFNKMPRFIVRPTPGNTLNFSQPLSKLYSSEYFNLMGLSAYIPTKPVEIISGNSKVETTVISKKNTANDIGNDKSHRPTKSPMQPLPR